MDSLQKLTTTVLVMFMLSRIADSVPNTNVVAALCNAGVYTSGDPFGLSLKYVAAELESVTPTIKGYDYYNISPYPNAFAYGHAACNRNLSASDCNVCLGVAKTSMFDSCPSRIGSRLVLIDCTMRYEQYPFDD